MLRATQFKSYGSNDCNPRLVAQTSLNEVSLFALTSKQQQREAEQLLRQETLHDFGFTFDELGQTRMAD